MVLVGCTYLQTTRQQTKAALDFAYNFGSQKQWQVYVEPSINFAFLGKDHSKVLTAAGIKNYDVNYDYKAVAQDGQPAYNINNSFVQLNAGVVYKFKNSNGTHNFTIVVPRDQAEIDALNAQINELRNQARADVVANYLKGRGVIVDEATGKGVQGVTSNRLAVVYVK